ncbi:hypothetical protein [Demequina globuliformis]|uniref:hypothetical protein n=1 Tax=Demequina globuliformis TaxID=676202 RepID=UPI000785F063|nr:hypothetical protein [Demequina globuliformis]
MSRFERDESADQVAPVKEWLQGEPISRAVMETVWNAEHGAPYESTIANYRWAVSLVLTHLWDGGDVPEPGWLRHAPQTFGITPVGARLIDALAFHVAHLYGVHERGWSVILDRTAILYGEAMVGDDGRSCASSTMSAALYWAEGGCGTSRFQFPFHVSRELAHAAAADAWPQDQDVVLAQARRASKRRLGGLLGKGAPTWHIDVPPMLAEAPPVTVIEEVAFRQLPVEELIQFVEPSDRVEFTYVVSVDNAALYQWGEKAYGQYESALAAQPGIDAVEGEDVEQLYVLAPTLSAEQALAAARAAAPRG